MEEIARDLPETALEVSEAVKLSVSEEGLLMSYCSAFRDNLMIPI